MRLYGYQEDKEYETKKSGVTEGGLIGLRNYFISELTVFVKGKAEAAVRSTLDENRQL